MIAVAAEPAPAAIAASGTPFLTLLQVLAALLLVLGVVWLLAWFARRVLPARGASGALKVVGGVMVGARERLVVVEVGETWVLVGVAAGNVRLVHTMPRPSAAATAAGSPSAALSKLLGDALHSQQVER
jgi:flagellar protein FliO/FliZ